MSPGGDSLEVCLLLVTKKMVVAVSYLHCIYIAKYDARFFVSLSF